MHQPHRDRAEQVGGEVLITADHGNVDRWPASTGQAHRAHLRAGTFVYVGPRKVSMRDGASFRWGRCPTLLGLPQPAEMTGRSILTLTTEPSCERPSGL